MALHRAQGADWSHISPEKWNYWQRLAARTHGIATPANVVSVVGVILVGLGLILAVSGSILWGILWIFVGRCADILDGIIAERTGTKGPIGEALDATVDKILIMAALAALTLVELLPLAVAVSMFIVSFYISAESLYAKRVRTALHPSQLGKLTTFTAWLTIALYLFAAYTSESLLTAPGIAAALTFIAFMIGSVLTAVAYTKQLRAGVRES